MRAIDHLYLNLKARCIFSKASVFVIALALSVMGFMGWSDTSVIARIASFSQQYIKRERQNKYSSILGKRTTTTLSPVQSSNQWVSRGLQGKSVSYLAIANNSPASLYAAIYGTGTFKAQEGIFDWQEINNKGQLPYAGPTGMVIDATNASAIYVSSNSPGLSGVYKTTDAGNSWTRSYGQISTPSVNGIIMDSQHSPTIYIGGASILKSSDEGMSWVSLNNLPAPLLLDSTTSYKPLAIDPNNSSIVYFAETVVSASQSGGGLLKTTDGGGNWQRIYNSFNADRNKYPSSPFYFSSLFVPKNSPNTLFQGEPVWSNKSTDGGITWNPVGVGPSAYIIASPLNPNILYWGSPGGVSRSTDGGNSWQFFNEGLPILSGVRVNALALNQSGNTLYAGTSDGVYSISINDSSCGSNCAPNAVKDFSIIANPNSAWSYGYTNMLGSAFTLYTDKDINVEQPGIERWFLLPDMNPSVNRNTTNTPLTGKTGSNTFPPDMLLLHPGRAGEYSIVRWTAPMAGTYKIEGIFKGLDIGITASTDDHILLNSSTSLFSTTINSFGETKPFSLTRTFAANDKIDFVVGYGGNTFHNDSTGLSVTITSVTEPCNPPSITSQPTGKQISSGEQVILTVAVSGTAPFSYQWYEGAKGDTSKPVGTNASTFTTPPLTANRNYWVRVSNSCDEVLSNTAIVSVQQASSLSGRVGIWDGQAFWKLDGERVSKIVIKVEGNGLSRETTASNGQYFFSGLPIGEYKLTATVEYTDKVTVDNRDIGGLKGCVSANLNKSSILTISNIKVADGSSFDIRYNPPLVMVHGIFSCWGKWTVSWDDYVRSNGYISMTPNYTYNGMISWEGNAKEVKEQIEANFKGLTRQATDALFPKWYYIAHSMGGLVGRVLVSGTNRNSVLVNALQKIYLLGTPNSGSYTVTGSLSFLSEDNIQKDFNTTFQGFGGKTVQAYAGNNDGKWGNRDSDGWVKTDSVYNIYIKECVKKRLARDTCTPRKLPSLTGETLFHGHGDLGSANSLSDILIDRIIPQVSAQFSSSLSALQMNARGENSTVQSLDFLPTLQRIKSQNFTLNGKQSTEFIFSVGASDLLVVNARAFSGSATYSLISPSGQVINFNLLSPILGEYHSDEFGETFSLLNPAPGQWTLKISAGENGGGLSALALENSPIGLDGSVFDPVIRQNQKANLFGQWPKNAIGLSSPSLTARIIDNAGAAIETVPLYDDGGHDDNQAGDGVFGGLTAAFLNTGRYTLIFTALGSLNGTIVARQAESFIDVAPSINTFTGVFGDIALDINQDGTNDTIREQIEIEVPSSGDFMIAADLQDSQGYSIDHATGYLRAEIKGKYSVNIDFKVTNLNCSQLDAPFIIKNITLTNAVNLNSLDIWGKDVLTQAYSKSLFSCSQGTPSPLVTGIQPASMLPSDTKQVVISGANFVEGASISLGDGITVSSIVFGNNNLLIAQLNISSNVQIGQKDLTVTNPDGRSSTTAHIFAVTKDQPPILGFTYPAHQQTIQGTVITSANVVDDYGIQKVEFYLNGRLMNADTAFPYQFIWDSSDSRNGDHTLVIKAFDSSGQTNTAQISVTTNNLIYEGDAAPRPNGNKNGSLTIADWVQVGRFVAGLDTVALGSEFQRVDCAPKITLGDGRITISDWVQAGRYAAGLDPVAIAGGTGLDTFLPLTGNELASPNKIEASAEIQARAVRAGNASFLRDQIGTLSIEIDAQGNENALSFSLNFDPSQLSFVGAILGDSANTASLQINSSQVTRGKVGIALSLTAGQSFVAGTQSVLKLRFIPMGGENDAITTISFSDQLLPREIADVNAIPVSNVDYKNATVSITRPAAAIVSAANYMGGEMAADSIVSVFGSQLATMTQSALNLPLPMSLGGTVVIIQDSQNTQRFAPLFYVSPTQINLQIPASTAEGVAKVTVYNASGMTTVGLLTVSKVNPALFTADSTGKGFAAGSVLQVRGDGFRYEKPIAEFNVTQNRFVALPIDLSEINERVYVTLYGTGLRNRSDLSQVKVKIDDIDMQVSYGGAQGSYAGLDQINFLLPRIVLWQGEKDIEIVVAGKQANKVKIHIK